MRWLASICFFFSVNAFSQKASTVSVNDFEKNLDTANVQLLDVRKPAEFADGHVKDAVNIPLSELNDPLSMSSIEDEHNVYVHCAGGYRSVIAASMLKKQGIHNIRNVLGGWNKIRQEEKIKIEKEKSVLN